MTDSLRDDLQHAFEVDKFRRSQPYDGVLGILPNEWPENFHREFERTRNKLLDEGFPPDELRSFIAEVIDIRKQALLNPENPTSFHPSTPFHIWDEIALLAGFLTASKLGTDEGLAFLMGRDNADLIKKGRAFVSGRRVGALKATTQYLIELRERFPNVRVKALYKIACNEASEGRGLCPFEYDHADDCLWDGDKSIDIIKFSKRLSKAKNRHLR